MITLHESDITSFPHDNGIGVLKDVIRAYAEEELNGLFEFYMEYDSEGHLVEELKEERIIKAKAQDKLGYQLFRIYSITKNHENDNLIVQAQHITYDLADNFVESLVANNLTKKQVMELIGSSTVLPHSFNVTSTNTTTRSSTRLYRTNPLQMVGGIEGSVLQIWGGQIERDNFNLILHDRRGSDDGVKVTYEKNITGLEATFDISGLVTRIFPFVYIEESDNSPARLITVSGKYIDSPLINNYEKIYIKPIDYSHDERINLDGTDAQIRQQLTNIASKYFEETGNDKIKVDMEVQFEHLWETEEYKDLAVLELVGMGDTVTIEHSRLKVNATAIVNYIRYDCIAEKNEEVRLGSVKARLTDSVNKVVDVAEKAEQAQQTANQAIKTANGKNTIYYGPDEPTNGIEGDLWFRVVDGEYTRTYRHDGIQWQLVLSVDVRDAIDEAQQAKDDAQQAVDTANQAFNSVDALSTMVNHNTGEISTIKQDVIGLQTTVGNLEDDVQSQFTQLSNAINLRVEKGDVINQINISDESILIDGKRIHITGQTTIDDAAIKSAHIESLDAGKVSVGTLVGHTLQAGYVEGSVITSNSTTNGNMLIEGGFLESRNPSTNLTTTIRNGAVLTKLNNIEVYMNATQGHGIKNLITDREVNLLPDKLLFINPPNDHSFTFESATGFHIRGGDVQFIGDSGFYGMVNIKKSTSSTRLLRFETDRPWEFISVGTGSTTALALRSEHDNKSFLIEGSGGRLLAEFRTYSNTNSQKQWVVINGDLDVFYDVNSNNMTTGSIANTAGTRVIDLLANGNVDVSAPGANLLLGYSGGTIRFYNNLEVWKDTSSDFYIRPNGATDVRIANRQGSWRNVLAASFIESSSEKWKREIERFEGSALDIINNSVIYKYKKEGHDLYEYGFVIERETPVEVIHGEGINGYSHRSLNTKAIQELSSICNRHDDEINWLKLKIQLLEQKIKMLEGKVA